MCLNYNIIAGTLGRHRQCSTPRTGPYDTNLTHILFMTLLGEYSKVIFVQINFKP
jgi:hypothetical protein